MELASRLAERQDPHAVADGRLRECVVREDVRLEVEGRLDKVAMVFSKERHTVEHPELVLLGQAAEVVDVAPHRSLDGRNIRLHRSVARLSQPSKHVHDVRRPRILQTPVIRFTPWRLGLGVRSPGGEEDA